jgi:hypothetical protein
MLGAEELATKGADEEFVEGGTGISVSEALCDGGAERGAGDGDSRGYGGTGGRTEPNVTVAGSPELEEPAAACIRATRAALRRSLLASMAADAR